jgi:hypothetical protein
MGDKTKGWLIGLIAGTISGGVGGVLTGFAAIGIDPDHFNLAAGLGFHNLLKIVGAACAINAFIATAAFLKKSPLPGVTEN